MTFDATFGRVFSPTFQPKSQASAAASVSWWLSGGISAANCKAAYQPKGAADIASSYINLNNPGTNNVANGNAPTFNTAVGWTFDGTSDYLVTGLVPASDQSWSAIVRLTGLNKALQNRTAFGVYAPGYGNLFSILGCGGSTNSVSGQNGKTAVQVTNFATDVTLAISGSKLYIEGVEQAGSFTAFNATITSQIYIGATNELSAAAAKLVGSIVAVAFYDTNIASYMTALTTAINAL